MQSGAMRFEAEPMASDAGAILCHQDAECAGWRARSTHSGAVLFSVGIESRKSQIYDLRQPGLATRLLTRRRWR